jgi:hypothetical protein
MDSSLSANDIELMHSLVRRYLKTAIVFLGVGLGIGIWMMAERELIGRFPGAYETSAHTHAILVGFVMMMILGVALWLFPRPARDDRRYTPRSAEAAYWLLTIGTAARIGGEIARPFTAALALRVATFSAALLQVTGLGLFFYTMWSRIRSAGSRAREDQGERF